MMKRCWEDLAQAIILQAVEDYRKARRRLRIDQRFLKGDEDKIRTCVHGRKMI